MKIKDLPDIDKPRLKQLDLDNFQDFICLYRDFIRDKRFTILLADGSAQVGFVAYYEKDGEEYGYGVRIGMGKANSFLRDKNKDLEEDRRWWNIHHYVGTDNPIQRIADQHLKETDRALNEIRELREHYLQLRDYIDGKLKAILDLSYIPTEGNK